MDSHPSRSSASVNTTSSSLLSRARAADSEAWRRLSALYGPMVYRWARQAGLQPDDAADVMQEVFHSVSRNLGRFQPQANGGGFRGWLWTVARNKIRDHFRRLKGKAQAAGGTAALEQIHQLPEQVPSGLSDQGDLETRGIRRRALDLVRGDFEEKTWRAFWRVTVEGDSPGDVADDLGVSVWTVYKAKARVLSRLREVLEDE